MRRALAISAVLTVACASGETSSPVAGPVDRPTTNNPTVPRGPSGPAPLPPPPGPEVLDEACRNGPPEGLFVPSLVYTPEAIDEAVAGTAVLLGWPIYLEVPFDWEQDPFENRVYRLGLQAWWGLAPLLHGHATQQNTEGLALAIALAVDWLEFYAVDFEGQSEFTWNGSAASFRAAYLAYMFRAGLCEGILSDEDATALWRGMIRHGEFLLEGSERYETNLGATHDAGLGLLGYQMPELPDAQRYIRTAADRMVPLFGQLLSADDLLREHTPWYHYLVLRDLHRGRLFEPRLASIYERAAVGARWFVAPDGLLVQFGDSHLIPPQPELVEGTSDPSGLRVFADTGYAVAREGTSYFAATGQFHSLVHKQRDELTFDWYERGRRIVSDTGRYGYFAEPGRDFALSAQAHSVLTVDGLDFTLGEPYGSAIDRGETVGDTYVVSGTNPLLASEGVTHRRWWLFTPNRSLVIVDRVTADRPRRFTRYVHLGPTFTTREGTNVIAEDGDLVVHVSDLTGATRTVVRGRQEPNVQGFTFPTNRVFVDRPTIVYDQTTDRTVFVTALGLDRPVDVSATATDVTVDGVRFDLAD